MWCTGGACQRHLILNILQLHIIQAFNSLQDLWNREEYILLHYGFTFKGWGLSWGFFGTFSGVTKGDLVSLTHAGATSDRLKACQVLSTTCGRAPTAVSYTHLDVYKRQPYKCWWVQYRKSVSIFLFWANLVMVHLWSRCSAHSETRLRLNSRTRESIYALASHKL